MSETTAVKRGRIQLRLDTRTKRKLERAATYEETSVSDFVLTNVTAAAERVIRAHESITLPAADWETFYEALMNPPEPNRTLRKAVRRYLRASGE